MISALDIAVFVIGNLIAYAIYRDREVPTWWDARWEQKLLRLLWPTAIIAYLLAPRKGPYQPPTPGRVS